jgi:NADH dehydrogenase (ubiquinone) 1 beta subcomplex subunit 7
MLRGSARYVLSRRKPQENSRERPGSSTSKPTKSLIYPFRGLQDERHGYEKCQYVEFKKRVAKMNELRESKEGARSN